MTKKLGLVFALSLLAVFVTAGSALATTTPPAPTNSAPPAFAAAASYFHVGYTVTATGGTWSDAKASLKYQWQLCAPGCTDIAKATSASYKPLLTQVGSGLRVRVTATNKGGTSDPAYSAISAPVSTAGSTHTVDPGFANGSYFHVGYTIAATPGTWAAPKATFKYQWQRCDFFFFCTDIAKATAPTYKLAATDNGMRIKVGVIATDAAKVASAVAYSAMSPAVSTAGPDNIQAPAITGYVHVGYSLTAVPGTWAAPKSTFKYQWQSCTDPDDLEACTDIAKATAATYKIVAGDAGNVLRVTVTAADLVKASSAANSEVTDPVANSLPVSVSPPIVSGLMLVGQTLKATAGTWDAPSTSATYQWTRCTSPTDPSDCTTIAKATSSSYKLVAADLDTYVRVAVTGINATKQASADPAYSDAWETTVDFGEAPANTEAPSFIWGGDAPQVGEYIVAEAGTWSGDPAPSYTFQWLRCAANSTGVNTTTGCSVIGGATNYWLRIVAADRTKTLRVRVTATNFVKSVSYVSDASSIVTGRTAPVNTLAPSMWDDPIVNDYASVQAGNWSGSPTGFSYQWQICSDDADLATCADIVGATEMYYWVGEADLDQFLRVGVKATNDLGTSASFVYSAVSVAVDYGTPIAMEDYPATITTFSDGHQTEPVGVVGEHLSASGGGWAYTKTWTKQWQACDADPESPGNADLASCSDIADATDWFYTVRTADVGKFLRIVITGHNPHHDGAPATSAVTTQIGAPPALIGSVSIDNTMPTEGDVLTATDDFYSGTPTPTVTYQWYALDDLGLGHSPTAADAIDGATSPTYTTQASDVGKHIRLIATATNAFGSVESLSNPTAAVGAAATPVAPAHVGSITIDNTTPKEGDTLTALDVTYTGDPAPDVTYLWVACVDPNVGTSCTWLGEDTSVTVPDWAVGKAIRVTSTATNGIGTDWSMSAATAPVVPIG